MGEADKKRIGRPHTREQRRTWAENRIKYRPPQSQTKVDWPRCKSALTWLPSAATFSSPPTRMPVITICNHKGGTGKTTTVMHLAAALGLGGKRVLVVDLDPQCFLTQIMGASEPTPGLSALALITHDANLRTLPMVKVSGFDLLPATQDMTRAQKKLTGPMDSFWIKEALATGHDYDVVIFDTAAALSVYTMNALVASDLVIVPVTPEYQPVVGAAQTWKTCQLVRKKLNPSLAEPLFLLTQVDGRKRDHAAYSQYIRATYAGRVMDSVVRTCATLADTTHDGRTVYDRDVVSRGARDYANAADELGRHFYPQRVTELVEHTETTEPEGEQYIPAHSGSGGGKAVLHAWIPLNHC